MDDGVSKALHQRPNLLWLINKYLKAGVMTDGVFEESEEGSS